MSLDESFFNGTTVLLLGNFETTLTRALFGPTPRPPNGFESAQNLDEAFAVKVSRGNMLDANWFAWLSPVARFISACLKFTFKVTNPHFSPERGCVVLDQPQRASLFNALRLVCDTAALRRLASSYSMPEGARRWLSFYNDAKFRQGGDENCYSITDSS